MARLPFGLYVFGGYLQRLMTEHGRIAEKTIRGESVVTDTGIEVPYSLRLKPLDEILARVRRPGEFFVHGAIESALPRLEIDGVGAVSFPVPPQQAKGACGAVRARAVRPRPGDPCR